MTTLAQDLSGYNAGRLREDLTAGLTVAMLAAPQAMAYATIADINPIYGLYAAIVVTLVASIFNSCSRLIHGPTNAISVMIADVGLVHVMDRLQIPPDQFMRVVFLLTFMIGAVQLAGALFRLGYLTNYISPSVIVGFTVGAAILIIGTQLPKVVGIEIPESTHSEMEGNWGHAGETLRSVGVFFGGLNNFHGPTMGIGLGSAIFTLTYRRWRRFVIRSRVDERGAAALLSRTVFYLPGPLLAIVGATVVTALLNLPERGVTLISLPAGRLPSPSVPLFDLDLARELFPSAMAIGFVGMIEAIGTGKSISGLTREPFNANGQLLGEALSNLAGGFFSGFAGSSSFTRSALNVDVGAATRLAGMFSALFVTLFLLVLSPLLNFIPMAALSGVLVAVGVTLIQSQPILKTMRGSRTDAIILGATALWAVLFSLEGAILIGVVLSVLFFMPRAAMLQKRWLIRDEKNLIREKAPDEADCSRLAIMDLEGAFFFGAIPSLEAALREFSADPREEKILRIHNAQYLDAPVADELIGFVHTLKQQGTHLSICGIRAQHVDMLRRQGLFELLDPGDLFLENNLSRSSTVQAVGAAYLRIGPHPCELCGKTEQKDMEPFMYTI